jgi:hypothetical protein
MDQTGEREIEILNECPAQEPIHRVLQTYLAFAPRY